MIVALSGPHVLTKVREQQTIARLDRMAYLTLGMIFNKYCKDAKMQTPKKTAENIKTLEQCG